MDAKRFLVLPDGFKETALAFPAKVDRALALIDDPKTARDMLLQADALAKIAKRIKAETKYTNAITYGKAKMAAKYAELVPLVPHKGRKRGQKQSKTDLLYFSKPTMALYRKILKHRDMLANYFEAEDDGEPKDLTLAGFVRVTSEVIAVKHRTNKRREAARDAPKNSRVIVGDFREQGSIIPDGSVSLVFTDPPYDRKASDMLPALGEFAATKLADGGSLICYVGQTQIPAALDALREHLRYWWTIACVHAGRATVMREYGIKAGWKAVLWFVKETRGDKTTMVSDVMSGGEEKSHHEWQQSESEAMYWIEKLCPTDGIVCDPFLGGGTTAVAAEAVGRRWIGFEVNEESAAIARNRLAS